MLFAVTVTVTREVVDALAHDQHDENYGKSFAQLMQPSLVVVTRCYLINAR